MLKSKRVLIVRPDRIGDTVLSTPIPRALKEENPDNFVAVLVRKYTKAVFENNPFVDEIINLDEEPSFIKTVKKLRKYNFTHSFSLLPTEKINYLLFFAGIKFRFGVGHKLYQFITNTKSVYRRKYIPLRSEADYCFDMARKIGINKQNLKTEIFLSEEEKKSVTEFKKELNPSNKILIGLQLSSGNSAPNWYPSEYIELYKLLKNSEKFEVVITDKDKFRETEDLTELKQPGINLSLRESFTYYAALDYLISASTGPMHISAALDVKTISLFCPLTACAPELWGPVGNEAFFILPEENYCQTKCPGDPKKCNYSGSKKVNALEVFNEINKIVEK